MFDGLERKPIEFAAIRILKLDSVVVSATSSSANGQFELKLDSGRYFLEASFLGYDTDQISINLTDDIPILDLDTIFLFEKSIELDGLSVVGKPPAVTVKGDTIEYSVGAYQGDEHDALQEIIRKLPGIELDGEGNLKANGKPIDKILIDGKEFFGNDIKRALTDLPAKMINKIQLFKKDSDEAEHTGFKNEETQEQVLNLQVKEEAKKSIFGEVEAGYGTEDKYNVAGSVYRMRDESQLMARGSINNLNRSLGGMMMSMGGAETGIVEKKEFGLTYNVSDKDKLDIESGIEYDDSRNFDKSEEESQYFLSSGDRFAQREFSSESQNKKLSGNASLSWKPDTLTQILFRTYLDHTETFNRNESIGKSYVVDTTYTNNNSYSEGKTNSANFNLYASRTLGKKDRKIAFVLRTNFRDGSDNGFNKSQTTYSLPTESAVILDQKSNAKNDSWGVGTGIIYTEPITDNTQLMGAYWIDKNKSARDREILKKDDMGQYSTVDTAYTRYSESSYIMQRIAVGLQTTKQDKYFYQISFQLLPQVLRTKVAFRDSIIDDLKQRVTNFSPGLMFSWKPEKDKSFSIYYLGMTEQPSLNQLSSDTTRLSATSRQYGNPNLKSGFRHDVNINYNSSNSEKEEFFSVYSSFGYTQNSVVNYSVMDSLGSTESTYRNVNGNMRANGGVSYSRGIKKVRASVYGGLNYSKNKGFVNGLASVADSYGFTTNFSLNYSHEKVDVFFQGDLSSNFTSSNISSSQDLDMTSYGFKSKITWRLPLDFTFSNDLSYNRNSKISDDLPQSNMLWHLTLSKSILKGKKGLLKVYANNVLDQRNDIQRVASDSQLSYTRQNTIGRYILFSFVYKFNIMGK